MKVFICFLLSIVIISCSNFYEFKNRTRLQETHRDFDIELSDQKNFVFSAYSDYYHDTVDLKAVYISKRDLRKLKKTTLGIHRNSQVLFLHNPIPYYLNIIGYYYPDLYLKEIGRPKFSFQEQELTNGFVFNYLYQENTISDFYVQKQNGVLRFLVIGNPKWHSKNLGSSENEIEYVFYILNNQTFKLKNKNL